MLSKVMEMVACSRIVAGKKNGDLQKSLIFIGAEKIY